MKTLILVVILFATHSALARLGESEEEIVRRYGVRQSREELGTNVWLGTFQSKEHTIRVYFRDNRAEAEVVEPIENRKFSVQERDSLTKSIGGDDVWVRADIGDIGVKSWRNTSTKAIACLQERLIGRDTLIIGSKEFVERAMNSQKKGKSSSTRP